MELTCVSTKWSEEGGKHCKILVPFLDSSPAEGGSYPSESSLDWEVSGDVARGGMLPEGKLSGGTVWIVMVWGSCATMTGSTKLQHAVITGHKRCCPHLIPPWGVWGGEGCLKKKTEKKTQTVLHNIDKTNASSQFKALDMQGKNFVLSLLPCTKKKNASVTTSTQLVHCDYIFFLSH